MFACSLLLLYNNNTVHVEIAHSTSWTSAYSQWISILYICACVCMVFECRLVLGLESSEFTDFSSERYNVVSTMHDFLPQTVADIIIDENTPVNASCFEDADVQMGNLHEGQRWELLLHVLRASSCTDGLEH